MISFSPETRPLKPSVFERRCTEKSFLFPMVKETSPLHFLRGGVALHIRFTFPQDYVISGCMGSFPGTRDGCWRDRDCQRRGWLTVGLMPCRSLDLNPFHIGLVFICQPPRAPADTILRPHPPQSTLSPVYLTSKSFHHSTSRELHVSFPGILRVPRLRTSRVTSLRPARTHTP